DGWSRRRRDRRSCWRGTVHRLATLARPRGTVTRRRLCQWTDPSSEDEPFVSDQHDRHGSRNQRAMEPSAGNASMAIERTDATAELRSPRPGHRSAILDRTDCLGYPDDRGTSRRRESSRAYSVPISPAEAVLHALARTGAQA